MIEGIKWEPYASDGQFWMLPCMDGKYVSIESYDQLRAQLEQSQATVGDLIRANDAKTNAYRDLEEKMESVTKERDAIAESWEICMRKKTEIVERLIKSQKQRDEARAQRDRAMSFIRHKVMCNFYDTDGDRECDCGYREVMEEIAKEKEGK